VVRAHDRSVIPDAAPERLTLPLIAPPPPRAPFPFVATAAPVLVSVGIWAVTGSVYSLLFAALGPVVAVGSLLDGRRQRRRTARRDADREVAALGRLQQRVLEAQEHERVRLAALAPPLAELCLPNGLVARWSRADLDGDAEDAAPRPVLLGRTRRASAVLIDGGAASHDLEDDLPDAVRAALGELNRAAAVLDDAPWLADARDGIGIAGSLPMARALARSVAVQLAASCSPQTTRIAAVVDPGGDEPWLTQLPHSATVAPPAGAHAEYRFSGSGRDLIVAYAAERADLPPGLGVIVDLSPTAEAVAPEVPLELVGAARAADAAKTMAAVAAERRMLAPRREVPDAVRLAEVLAASDRESASESARSGLRAPVGRDAAGVVELDLVRDGPHAVVAGTTGAGKSELLVSWVLAMAARHPPSAVTFLLVDFKGGAAFAPLAGLPHVLGTVSDLDGRRSARAIESLRAELLRRERILFDGGARSIDEWESRAAAPGERLARLVIVVDEFAAVVSGQPELHELFADLAGRGRSLGLHLILCTQRPSGVVRDAVLANVMLRISLRVTDRGDSLAMLGTDAATRLAPTARGRALIADGSGDVREVQLAIADPGDADALRGDGRPRAENMWCDPLPELIPLETLARDPVADGESGIPFGRVDLPAQQRQPVARHDPRSDGHLLVLGAARSGRTTVLRTLAEGAAAAGIARIVVANDPAEASSLLVELLERPPSDVTLVLFDDLDLALARMDPDARHEFADLLSGLLRSTRRLSLVVTAQRLTGPLQSLAGLVDARLLLRQPSRDEHVLAGGDGSTFDARLPPGAATWTGSRGHGASLQVAIGSAELPPAELVDLPHLRPRIGRALAVVCRRPAELAPGLIAAGARVIVLGDGAAPDADELRVSRGEAPVVLLGDPDAWQAEWALLNLVRRDLPIVVSGCSGSELRAVTRARDAPPPLGSRPGECWWVDDGRVRRAVLDLDPDHDPAPPPARGSD
jgi:S-DNA-T family DNA segregation ATPase FtsK/SpoIIIE